MTSQGAFYPHIAYNNTYGIEAISKHEYEKSTTAFRKPGGCLDRSFECRRLARELDPENRGDSVEVNEACGVADLVCYKELLVPYGKSGVSILEMDLCWCGWMC
jgi:hypothetical protein